MRALGAQGAGAKDNKAGGAGFIANSILVNMTMRNLIAVGELQGRVKEVGIAKVARL